MEEANDDDTCVHALLTKPSSVDDAGTFSLVQVAWAIVQSVFENEESVSWDCCYPHGAKDGITALAGERSPNNIKTITLDVTNETCTADLYQRVRDWSEPLMDGFQTTSEGALASGRIILAWDEQEQLAKPGAVSHNLSLYFSVAKDNNHIKVTAQTHGEVADKKTARQVRHLTHILPQLDPRTTSHQKVLDIHLLDERDGEQLRQWLVPPSPTEHGFVQDAIAEWASRTPQSEALCSSFEGSMSYAELEKHVVCLAAKLKRKGVSPATYVPICFDKSNWTVVAMLAVLRAGGAYVPLDPLYPRNRFEAILGQLGKSSRMVLCSAEYEGLLESLGCTPLIIGCNSREMCGMGGPYSCLENSPPRSSSAAYAIFTSGSTGIPKGVVIEHSQLRAGVSSWNRCFNVTSKTRMLQFTAYTFDPSIFEIFSVLSMGGTVCTPSASSRMNDLGHAVRATNANYALLTPSVIQTLQPEDLIGIQTLLLGAERVPAELARFWSAQDKTVSIIYGPTEACIFSSYLKITSGKAPLTGDIGGPLASNLAIVSPDSHEQLVPIGAVGELAVEGPTVARGYMNVPRSTKAAFAASAPWLEQLVGSTSGRLYYTGDLVRYRDNGSLEFLGRKDLQVKIRGFRIELEEVQETMRQLLPPRSEVAVDVLETISNGRQITSLVAFVPSTRGGVQKKANGVIPCPKPDNARRHPFEDLERGLRESLPSYMIPTHFIPMETLPHATSGKLDRKRLRQVATQLLGGETKLNVGETVIEPRTENEKILRRLWAAAFRLEEARISVDADFWRDLGGDSILAITLVSLSRRQGLRLTVDLLHQKPLLADLASELQQSQDDEDDIPPFSLLDCSINIPLLKDDASHQCHVPVESIEDAYPITPHQQLFISASKITPCTWQSSNVFHVRPDVDMKRLQMAWNILVGKHDILRTRMIDTEQGHFQVLLSEQRTDWSEASDLDTWLEKVKHVNIGAGAPHGQCCLVRQTSPEPTLLIWTCKQTHFDALSSAIITADLGRIYGHLSAEESSTPFKHRVKLQLAADNETTRAFWASHYAGARFKCLFPVPEGYKPETNDVVATRVSVQAPKTAGVRKPAMIAAAWALLLAKYDNATDILFRINSAGRSAPVAGIEQTLGPVVTELFLRVSVNLEDDPLTFLKRTQSVWDSTRAHEFLPMSIIEQACPEVAEHERCKVTLNVLPEFGADVDPTGLLQPPKEVKHRGFTYPFLIGCQLHGDGLSTATPFDNRIVRKEAVKGMVDRFEGVIRAFEAPDRSRTLQSIWYESLE